MVSITPFLFFYASKSTPEWLTLPSPPFFAFSSRIIHHLLSQSTHPSLSLSIFLVRIFPVRSARSARRIFLLASTHPSSPLPSRLVPRQPLFKTPTHDPMPSLLCYDVLPSIIRTVLSFCTLRFSFSFSSLLFCSSTTSFFSFVLPLSPLSPFFFTPSFPLCFSFLSLLRVSRVSFNWFRYLFVLRLLFRFVFRRYHRSTCFASYNPGVWGERRGFWG